MSPFPCVFLLLFNTSKVVVSSPLFPFSSQFKRVELAVLPSHEFAIALLLLENIKQGVHDQPSNFKAEDNLHFAVPRLASIQIADIASLTYWDKAIEPRILQSTYENQSRQ